MSSIVFDIVMLVASLGCILTACFLFTNAIEKLGERLSLHQGTVGSILAAVGTALPETIVPLVAILLIGDEQAKDVAVGAIAGAPFMLGTLAFFVTGASTLVYTALGKRTRIMNVDETILSRDLTFFLVLYGIAVATTFAHELRAVKVIIAAVLLLAYSVYIKVTVSSVAKEMEDVGQLYICRILRIESALPWTLLQLAGSLGLIVGGAHLFVGYVEALSTAIGMSAMVLSLIITPIATELPEKFNSIIWVGRKKDTLALGNITGAMVFQSCFPVAFGIVGTHWDLLRDRGITLLSAGLALLSAAFIVTWVKLRRSLSPFALLIGAVLYAVFLIYLFRPA